MKKKVLGLTLLLLASIVSLSGCTFLHHLLNPHTIFEEGYVDPDDPNYKPWINDKEAISPLYTYKHYIANNYYTKSSTPISGDVKLLLIPIWFSDSDTFISLNKKEELRDDIRKAYFGTTEETGWHSVSSYYKTESQNILKLNGDVSNWYDSSKSYLDLARDSSSYHNLTVNLVKEATDWYFEQNENVSRNDYDYDNDGYLDGVIFIYAAPNVYSLKQKNPDLDERNYQNLWAYCFWTSLGSNIVRPSLNAFFWASYDFMYDIDNPKLGQYGFGGTGYRVDAHTYIHEMGHMFGLDDYYDYGSDHYSPAGGYSMQDENVGGHDPFSVYALGWAKAYIPGDSTTIELTPFQQSHEVIILSPRFTNSPFDEYLMLEFYDASSLNEKDANERYMNRVTQGVKQAGIRLWHVDARLLYGNSESSFQTSQNITTNPTYKMVSITRSGVLMMNSNTYDRNDEHSTKVREKNANLYNILQVIHADKRSDAIASKLSNQSIFTLNQSFSMEDYRSQFVNGDKLNSGLDLGFKFTVTELTASHVKVQIENLNESVPNE